MKVAYLLALLPAVYAAAALPQEDASAHQLYRRANNYAAIKKALLKSAADTQTFSKDLDTVPDNGPITPSQEIKLQNDISAIESDLQKAGKACNTTSDFTAAQSKSGYNDLVTLEQLVSAVLTDTVNHKPAFTSAGLISLVCTDLADLKGQVDSLGPCLASHSTAAYAAKAKALQAKYDSDFSNAQTSLGC